MNLFEITILDKIQDIFACKFMDTLMPIISYFGDYGIVCIAISLVLIIIKKTRKAGITAGLSLLIGLLICNILLKPLVARTRPFEINTAFKMVIEPLYDGSFPSGHALACFEFATAIMFFNKKFGIISLVIAALVSFSRLYLYMHYPTDVIIGALIGVGIGMLSYFVVDKVYKKYDLKNKWG